MNAASTKSKNAPRSRYLRSAKVSDYHMGRIVILFASGVSAAEAQRQVRLSYVTVRKLYALIRRRLVEVGYFASMEKRVRAAEAEDDAGALERDLDTVNAALRRRRGTREGQRADHVAELLFRLDDGRSLVRARGAHELALDMRKALLRSGPINRPLTADGLARATAYLLQRALDRRVEEALGTFTARLPALSALLKARPEHDAG